MVEWIDIEDRKPKGLVMVAFAGCVGTADAYTTFAGKLMFDFNDGGARGRSSSVTHWAELPAGPGKNK